MTTVRFTANPHPTTNLIVDTDGYVLMGDWLVVHSKRKRAGALPEATCPHLGTQCWGQDYGIAKAREVTEAWMTNGYDDRIIWTEFEQLYVRHLGRLV